MFAKKPRAWRIFVSVVVVLGLFWRVLPGNSHLLSRAVRQPASYTDQIGWHAAGTPWMNNGNLIVFRSPMDGTIRSNILPTCIDIQGRDSHPLPGLEHRLTLQHKTRDQVTIRQVSPDGKWLLWEDVIGRESVWVVSSMTDDHFLSIPFTVSGASEIPIWLSDSSGWLAVEGLPSNQTAVIYSVKNGAPIQKCPGLKLNGWVIG